MGEKKVYLTPLQYRIYQILKEIKKDTISLYEIAEKLNLKPADVFRSLLFLKNKGVIDFDEVKDKYYGKTYKIILKNLKKIEEVTKSVNYVIAKILE